MICERCCIFLPKRAAKVRHLCAANVRPRFSTVHRMLLQYLSDDIRSNIKHTAIICYLFVSEFVTNAVSIFKILAQFQTLEEIHLVHTYLFLVDILDIRPTKRFFFFISRMIEPQRKFYSVNPSRVEKKDYERHQPTK